MFHNMFLTGLITPSNTANEVSSWENKQSARVWPERKQKASKATEITKTIKKKPWQNRTSFTAEQLRVLEETYACSKYIKNKVRRQLAASTKLSDKCIKTWFQNRRKREKRHSESSCDSSVENITTAASLPVKQLQNLDLNEEKGSFSCINSLQHNHHNTESQYIFVQNDNSVQVYGVFYTEQPGTAFCKDTTVYPTEYYPNY